MDLCIEDLDITEAIQQAILSACDAPEAIQVAEFYKFLFPMIKIQPSVAFKCPKYSCALNEILNGSASTGFICDLFSAFEDGATDILLNISAIDFTASGLNSAGFAVTTLIEPQPSVYIINIQINTLKCTSHSVLEVFETLQHEMVHADIKRRLVDNYGAEDVDALSQDAAFHQLVLDVYGSNAGSTEHQLMAEFYVDKMAESLLAANDGIGSIEMFKNLIRYGLGTGTVAYCDYNTSELAADYATFQAWAAIPGNIGPTLSACP